MDSPTTAPRRVSSFGGYIEVIAATGNGTWAYWCTFVIAMVAGVTSMQFLATPYIVNGAAESFPAYRDNVALIPSVTFAGLLIGFLVVAPLANSFGRKRVLMCVTLAMAVITLLSAVSPTFEMLLLFRFLNGVFQSPWVVGVSLLVEVVESDRRGILGNCASNIFWGMGSTTCSILAWMIMPHYGWRMFLVALAIPYLVNVALISTLAESPQWLLSQGRLEEAKAALDDMANINGSPALDYSLYTMSEGQTRQSSQSWSTSLKRMMKDYQMLFEGGRAALMLYMSIAWACLRFSYNSVTMFDESLLGSAADGGHGFDYGFEVMISTSEIVFGLLVFPFVDKAHLSPWIGGRVGTQTSACLLCGISLCLLSCGVRPLIDWAYMSRGLSHNFFAIMTVHANEVFDLQLRSTGIAFLFAVGMLASVGGSYWVYSQFSTATVGLGIALATFVGMLATFKIPETAAGELDVIKTH